MTAHFVSNHLACVTFLIDKHRSSGQNSPQWVHQDTPAWCRPTERPL